MEQGRTQWLSGGDHQPYFFQTGREDRQAADRRNPRRGQTERHRHVDLAKRDGTASADPDHRPGGRDAGLVRVREGTRAGQRDLSATHTALQQRPRALSSRNWAARFLPG